MIAIPAIWSALANQNCHATIHKKHIRVYDTCSAAGICVLRSRESGVCMRIIEEEYRQYRWVFRRVIIIQDESNYQVRCYNEH
jgi:hypothetical protein